MPTDPVQTRPRIPPPLDVATLNDLRALGDDAMRALISLFLTDSALRIGRLRRALIAGQTAEFSPIAHSLTGSCASFGAQTLSGLCTSLEHLSPGACRAATGIVEAIETEFGRVRDTLLEELARIRPPGDQSRDY